eukprot:scaffold3958_cov103-Isochrysis_galbana.AAC.3
MPHLSFPLPLKNGFVFGVLRVGATAGGTGLGRRLWEGEDRLRGASLLPLSLPSPGKKVLLCTQAPFSALARVEGSVLYALGGWGWGLLAVKSKRCDADSICPSGAAFEKPQEEEVALGMSRGTRNYTWAWPTPCPPCTQGVCLHAALSVALCLVLGSAVTL